MCGKLHVYVNISMYANVYTYSYMCVYLYKYKYICLYVCSGVRQTKNKYLCVCKQIYT